MEITPSPPACTNPGPSNVAPVVVVPNATRACAELLHQDLAISQSILQRNGQSVLCETYRQLARCPFCLPGFDQHQGIFCAPAFAGSFDDPDRKCLFISMCVHQARAMLAQRAQAGLPAAQHGDVVAGVRQPPGEQRRQRACAEDQNLIGSAPFTRSIGFS